MKKQRLVVLMMGASLALINAANGQPVTNQDISGNECWNAGQGPGGPSQFLCISQVRNGAAIRVVSGATAAVTVAQTQADSTIMWTGTAPTTLIINLVASPFDGEIVSLGTDTTITTAVTFVAGGTTTLNTAITTATITPTTGIELQFSRATTKWFRVR